MIHYQLRCSRDHEFDGWFKDSAAFDSQAGRGLVECPACGDVAVSRAMMAPAVAKRPVPPARMPEPPAPPQPAPQQMPVQASAISAPSRGAPSQGVSAPGAPGQGPLPDQMRAMLQRMRAEVERNCDYVGERFADEALRIHRGETEARGIYGEATQDQAESLAEEGVGFARIPWVPRAEG